MKTVKSATSEAEGRRKDGSTITCLTSGVLAEIDGRLCCLGVTRDISELKAAERKLRKNETMLRAIFDASLDNVTLIDLTDQTIIEVNPRVDQDHRLLTRRNSRQDIRRAGSSSGSGAAGQILSMLMEGREVRNYEMNVADRQGRTLPVLISASTLSLRGASLRAVGRP